MLGHVHVLEKGLDLLLGSADDGEPDGRRFCGL